MRKLATVTKIKEIIPILNADAIEAVSMTTNSWIVVVKKGDFKPGDFAVYFEIDSFIPAYKNGVQIERFKFLDGRSNKKMDEVDGYRLKTVKLRGQISQGLVLPLSLFPEIVKPAEGNDVTEKLGILLYESPQSILERSSGVREKTRSFPVFVRKTDQKRIQSFESYEVDELLNDSFEVTIKLDGSSGTYGYHQGRFFVCSRNLELGSPLRKDSFFVRFFNWVAGLFSKQKNKEPVRMSLWWKMAVKYEMEKKLTEWNSRTSRNIAVQGEIVGEGIQSNREKIAGHEQEFYVFDIWDIDKQQCIAPEERRKITKELGLKHVPVLQEHQTMPPKRETLVETLLEMAEGDGMNTNNREGIVFKSNENPNRSFKVISNRYLLTLKD